ncbi:hypothetical protein LOZ53_003091 [Ophidiomyces ophidiicola]|nr:hypothetical protein LOZ55_001236 [Ophidiomyces ophidiicola]KAI1990785.1 hypothetical protein LOZ53_003091 [Ophidiomyces ophidiicola]KAI1992723.1 hypothetical protein LOZ54_001589 [Ophidiomyces ophidiicola]KAI1999388.1 hypothetical protein LOZ51_001875 [Ophidiomyces ophidiicola]
MEFLLQSLNSHLVSVRDHLRGKLHDDLVSRLHNHDEGALPDMDLATIAAESIDLLHSIEQMLEPGQLVLADHFLGERFIHSRKQPINIDQGYVNAKCLCSAVELKIPEILQEKGASTVEELASLCGAHVDRLRQVLRILHNNGIFKYSPGKGCYENNSTSTLLLRDHWTQWHNWIDLYGNQFYDMARGIPKSVQASENRSPAQVNFDTDMDMFNYFNKCGWVPQLHRTLGGGATAQGPGIIADYPWSEVANETIIDIGGGSGALISLLLRTHKTMQGGIYDLPHVIDHVTPFFHSPDGQFADLADRVPRENLIGGDFFKSIPPSKVYTMKWTLHNWKEAEALKILRNIRQSIIPSPKSRLVVMESILADGRSSRLSRYADMNMFIAVNGLERTATEWRNLAENSGWRIVRIIPLRNSWPAAIEMTPDVPRQNGWADS